MGNLGFQTISEPSHDYVFKKIFLPFSQSFCPSDAQQFFVFTSIVYLLCKSKNLVIKSVNGPDLDKLWYFGYIIMYLAQTPEIGQGLGRFLSCGERKHEQT